MSAWITRPAFPPPRVSSCGIHGANLDILALTGVYCAVIMGPHAGLRRKHRPDADHSAVSWLKKGPTRRATADCRPLPLPPAQERELLEQMHVLLVLEERAVQGRDQLL